MAAPVVADAGPLITFERLGRLDLLEAMFGVVVVAPVVAREIGPALLSGNRWLEVRPIPQPPPALPEHGTLHAGEFETLRLAVALDAGLILLDDRAARQWASRQGIPITGSAGLLVQAKARGLIPRIAPLLAEARARGAYIDLATCAHALRLAGEE